MALLFCFDFDDTLVRYDFRRRLPRLAELTGLSQYRLAKDWWAAGHERAAEAGVYADGGEYLAAFEAATGARLTAAQWCEARLAAMTPMPAALAALRRAAELGTASLLSNNPMIFREHLRDLAPEVAELLGPNDLVSAQLGARKPERRAFTRALGRYGVPPERAFFADDARRNTEAAAELGLGVFQVPRSGGAPDADGMLAAVEAFAASR